MLGEMLRAEMERRWTRLAALAGLFAAIPALYAIRLWHVQERWFALRYEETSIVTRVMFWGLVCGSALWGFDTWSPERRSGWVYVLALPVRRLRLFAAKYVAGLICLGAAVAALVAASYLAAVVVTRPAGFYAYPGSFSTWIALPALLLYTLGFVIGARSQRGATVLIMVLAAATVALAVFHPRNASIDRGGEWRVSPTSPIGLLAQSPRLFDY